MSDPQPETRRPLLRRLAAILAAVAVFAMVVLAVAVATPYALGWLFNCSPPVGSCGDGVGWSMIFLSPVLVPLTLLLAAGLSFWTYFRIVRGKASGRQGE
jgi:hypothetical protein